MLDIGKAPQPVSHVWQEGIEQAAERNTAPGKGRPPG